MQFLYEIFVDLEERLSDEIVGLTSTTPLARLEGLC